LKSVESYDPNLDVWTPVTQMSTSRRYHGIGVIDDVMYAIGGVYQEHGNLVYLKSVEAYTSIANVWSPIADMHLCRFDPSNFKN